MSNPQNATNGEPTAEERRRNRVFLVVVDDSQEMPVALRYACLRVLKGGGRVALLRVTEPVEFQTFGAVGDLMRQEKRDEAEQLLQKLAAEVNRMTGAVPALYVREGVARDEVLALLDEESARISALVLASSVSAEGPGPLISALAGKYANRLHKPLIIVPGSMTEADLEAVT